MNSITRRRLFRAAPAAASLAVLPRETRAAAASGPLKITRIVLHKCTLRWRDLLFVEVHTDGGIVGIGEGTCHNRVDVVEAALRWLEPYLIGQDPAGVEAQWERLYYRLTRWRTGIIITTALSAIDIALWDIEGKRLGVPVWRLLGGPIQPRYRVYFTHMNNRMQGRGPEAYAARAAELLDKGWTAVKFAVPQAPTERERIKNLAAVLAAIRNAVGDRLDVGLELFESCTTRTALKIAEAVQEFSPMFIEEPLPRENPYAFGELAAKSPVPVATGEGVLSRQEFRPLLEVNGAAIIQPDVVKCSGITEMRKIANYAEVYGAEVAPHQCYGPVAHVASLATVSVCRNFLIHEWEGDDDALFQEVTKGVYPVQKDGFVSLPQGPGLGIDVDFAQLVKRFPYQRKL
jgi:galactonate dehydratase